MQSGLREARLARGWRQTETAKMLGISKQSMNDFEKGRRRAYTALLMQMEELFGMSYRELFNLPPLGHGSNTGS